MRSTAMLGELGSSNETLGGRHSDASGEQLREASAQLLTKKNFDAYDALVNYVENHDSFGDVELDVAVRWPVRSTRRRGRVESAAEAIAAAAAVYQRQVAHSCGEGVLAERQKAFT